MPSFAIAILSWQRPEYLKRCLDSLVQNDTSDVDVHLFQDGAVCPYTGQTRAQPKLIQESLALWERASFHYKETHAHGQNVGMVGQRIFSMPYLARRYRWFACLDSDVVLAPHAVRLMRVMLEQFEDDPDVASVSPGFRPLCRPGSEERYVDAVFLTSGNIGHFWCEAYWGRKWVQRLEPNFLQYCEHVLPHPYHEHERYKATVVRWARSLGAIEGPSSDTAIQRAIDLVGMKRAWPVLNRATGIGEVGLHSTPTLFRTLPDANRPYHNAPEDASLSRFRPVSKRQLDLSAVDVRSEG